MVLEAVAVVARRREVAVDPLVASRPEGLTKLTAPPRVVEP
jgi:hypothetical protein